MKLLKQNTEMGKNDKAPKKGFMHWYESYQGKKVVGCFYSLGASVVIIGALFKIMHFPGAGPMLIVGMGVEALLFAIGCLDRPHADFHWENVFPQLVGHGADPKLIKELEDRPCPTLMGSNGKGSADVPALSEKDLEGLKAGINKLSQTATNLSELGTLATATTGLSSKLDAAGHAAQQFVEAGKLVSEKSAALSDTYVKVTADMEKVVEGTKAYETQVSAISSQLTSLNAVYEMQLKALQAQSEKIAGASAQVENLAAGMKSMLDTTHEALEGHKAYAAGAKQLAGQLADLNKVYGNMLNALS